MSVRSQLDDVVDAVCDALGDAVSAVYLYGSSVAGGLRPASDLDVFVLVDRSLAESERSDLIDGLLAVSAPPGDPSGRRPVEVTVVRHALLRPWPDEPMRELQFGEWLRADFAAGHRSPPTIDADLAALVATVHAASTAIVGPPAVELLPPVPQAALVAGMRRSVPALLDELDTDTTNVLLTLCRMVVTASTGRIVAKDDAVDWVVGHHPIETVAPIGTARRCYRLGLRHQDDYRDDEVHAVATSLVELIEATVGGAGADTDGRP